VARTAVVTGGGGGIGGAIVAALRDDGLRVVVLDKDGDAPVDLSEPSDIERAIADVAACDVFVHAAASFDRFDLASFDLAAWRSVQAVNVEAGLMLARAFAPGMTAGGFGRMIFITSNTALRPPRPDLLPYVASKSALEGAVRTLALELGPAGITVNAVAPGLTRTPAAEAGMPPDAFEAVRAAQALPRTLEPADIAGAVAFLASDRAAAITGQTICVDGGLVFR
jgi:NAD(P)-dependent dehydrogenase (short-subunit alcohol dehydrogenase family)